MKKPGPRVEPAIGPVKRTTVSLDEKTIELLRIIGRGNVSKGIRRAARVAMMSRPK
jgi:hypothetical protein